ncbi:MAG: AsmA-like C-terminal region-containing protein [Methyloceanibacter sp.]
MKPRQIDRKWILLGVGALLLCGLVIVPRLAGGSSALAKRATDALATWTGGEVKLTGPLRMQYFPDIALRSGIELASVPNLPLVKSIVAKEARISLDLPAILLGHVRIDAVRLIEAEIALKEAPSLVMGPEQTLQARIANLLSGPPFRVLRMEGGVVKIPTASGNETVEALDARFDLSSGALAGSGSFVLRKEPVSFTLDTGAPSETGDGLSVPASLSFDAPALDAALTGTASFANGLQFDGDVEAATSDARAFLRWTGIALAEGKSLKALSASGTAHWNGTTLTFDDGTFVLDGNEAVGALAVTPGVRPRIDGTLAFDRLALDPYAGGEDAADAAAPARPDQSVLSHFDTDLRISAAEITAPGIQLGRGGFTVSADEGRISSDVGELEFCGGTAAGRIDVDLSQATDSLKMAGKLSDVPIETCLEPLGLHLPLKGTGILRVDFSATGQTYDALMRGLEGPFRFKARRGAVFIDLTRLLAGADAQQGGGWSRDNVTAFDELVADCRLGDGHIWCQKFNMKTEQGLISGSGDINLGQQTLDWRLFAADGAAPVNDAQLAAGTPPQVAISGALMQPVISSAEQAPAHSGSLPTASRSSEVSPR